MRRKTYEYSFQEKAQNLRDMLGAAQCRERTIKAIAEDMVADMKDASLTPVKIVLVYESDAKDEERSPNYTPGDRLDMLLEIAKEAHGTATRAPDSAIVALYKRKMSGESLTEEERSTLRFAAHEGAARAKLNAEIFTSCADIASKLGYVEYDEFIRIMLPQKALQMYRDMQSMSSDHIRAAASLLDRLFQ